MLFFFAFFWPDGGTGCALHLDLGRAKLPLSRRGQQTLQLDVAVAKGRGRSARFWPAMMNRSQNVSGKALAAGFCSAPAASALPLRHLLQLAAPGIHNSLGAHGNQFPLTAFYSLDDFWNRLLDSMKSRSRNLSLKAGNCLVLSLFV